MDKDQNTGNRNTGYWNTGVWNTGDTNTGDRNTGNSNTGDRNTGYWNTGDTNTGDTNTGDTNTGDTNTGDRNTGDSNTGDWNTGDRNTGHWNIVNKETGHFNTTQSETIRIFNKEYSINEWENTEKPHFIYKVFLTEWIPESEMSETEKECNSTYKTTGGYLKEFSYKEAWKKAYDKASKKDIELLKKLPNFDAEVFKEISGIDITVDNFEEMTMEEVCKELGRKIKIKK